MAARTLKRHYCRPLWTAGKLAYRRCAAQLIKSTALFFPSESVSSVNSDRLTAIEIDKGRWRRPHAHFFRRALVPPFLDSAVRVSCHRMSLIKSLIYPPREQDGSAILRSQILSAVSCIEWLRHKFNTAPRSREFEKRHQRRRLMIDGEFMGPPSRPPLPPSLRFRTVTVGTI